MASIVRRSTRSRSGLHVQFADEPDYDEETYDQGDDDKMDELPVARVKQEQPRHPNQNNNTTSGILKKGRGRSVKRDDHDEDWPVEEEFSSVTPRDVTLSSEGNPSVYEFSESSNTALRDSTKASIKIRRDEKHLCPYCNYCTGKKYLLQRHLKSHSTERPHKCTYCSHTFKTTAQLQNHVNTHLGIKPFQCKFCEYKFTTSGELIRHGRYKHTMEKPHKCEECGYATVELSKLRRHIRTHTGEKPYACPHCPYRSPDTFKLKRHIRVHTGERPYQCTICKFRFTQSNSLKAHMLTHQTNAQKFRCTQCPTVLTRKADLKQHMIKKHANNDDFLTCLKCDQKFADLQELNQHKKLHHVNTNISKPRGQFSCSLCAFKTFSKNIFDDHMDSEHRDDRTYQCTECGLMYTTRGDLRQHITKVHRCGVYANIPAGGLSSRPKSSLSISKNSQPSFSPSSSLSPTKEATSQRETVYRCSLCRSQFSHQRAIERHHYDVHRIDPFDSEAMKNATTENEHIPEAEIPNRMREEQMTIIQFRNQHQNSEQSPLIVKIERDGYDNFETADDFPSNKPTAHTRQSSKNIYDHSSTMKKDFSQDSYDDYMDGDEQEYETADIFVEIIDDEANFVDDDEANVVFKYRSSTHKSIEFL